MNGKEYRFEELNEAPLYIDAIYHGGKKGGYADDVLTKLLPNMRNEGGFRIVQRKDGSGRPAYVALSLSGYEPAWPDHYDNETGILTYYGDNRTPGCGVEQTPMKGNQLLRLMYWWLSIGGESLSNIPPILVFQKTGERRNVRFIGLAVPGIHNVSQDEYFTTIWRTKEEQRFPNYVAKFTIVDLEDEEISKVWLEKLIYDNDKSLEYAPTVWKKFVKHGLASVKPIIAPNVIEYPSREMQLPQDKEGMKILKKIHERYGTRDPFGFEKFSRAFMYKMDSNYRNINLTRPWRDGGRDGVAEYIIETPSNKLKVECAMEAKSFDPESRKGVGVKATSRLISRIRHRQFGILITTAYIDKQAYLEVKEDGHPILFCTGSDIAKVLQLKEGVTSENIDAWLDKNVK